MFTSGSTGILKGVIHPPELVLHTAYINQTIYHFTTDDRIALFASFGFGAAITGIFMALLNGAALFFPQYTSTRDLIEWIRENNISILAQIPMGLNRQMKGGIIKIYPDTDDDSGQFHLVNLLGHQYHIKAGFAELSLRALAPIIPINFKLQPDGQFVMVFHPALRPIGNDHNERVESLLGQYASFVRECFALHPGSILWKKYEDLSKIPLSNE